MPTPLIKSYAKKTGKTEAQVEELWRKAQDQAKAKYDVKNAPRLYWSVVNGTLKKMLGLSEAIGFKDWLAELDISFDTQADVTQEPATAKAPPVEENAVNNSASLISSLFWIRDVAHEYHLKTHSYAEHQALGEFYDKLIAKTDELAELIQGRYGLLQSVRPIAPYIEGNERTPQTFISQASTWLEGSKGLLPSESYIQNVFDEILAIVFTTKYKIDNLK